MILIFSIIFYLALLINYKKINIEGETTITIVFINFVNEIVIAYI